jgi:hypothetical protein
MRTESTRDICPAPMPSVRRRREHDRVRLDVLADAPGEVEVAQLLGRGRALRHDLGAPRRGRVASRVCTSSRPRRCALERARARRRDVARQQAQVLLRGQRRQRLGAYAGAITHSRNVSLISRASSPSTGG